MARADQRKFHYIYKITRTDGSGKYYIGMHSTDDLEDGYFGSGKILWHSINKHGKEKHVMEIMEFHESRTAVKERERELVNEELLKDPLCMNIKRGGDGGWDHIQPNSENARKIGAIGGAKSGKQNWSKACAGITSDSRRKALETRALNGKPFTTKGLTFSDKTKNNMSKSATGANNSQYGKCWVTNQRQSFLVDPINLDEYLKNGFKRGRKIKVV